MRHGLLAVAFALLVNVLPGAAWADPPAPVKTAAAEEKGMLLGDHPLTLQWISWDQPGRVTVTEQDGVLHLEGEQRQAKAGNYLTVKGQVVGLRAGAFVLEGEVDMRIDHVADGKSCKRTGKLEFRRTGKRRYWRMRPMQNPCDNVTDYVDIYLAKAPR